MTRSTRITIVLVFLLLLAVFLAVVGCAPSPRPTTQTCGTIDTPPIAADRQLCDNAAPGYRWWTAPAADVSEPDERPVIGQELDGDWWDPVEQADLDDRPKVRTTPGPRSAPTTGPALATPPPTSRASAPPSRPARPSTSGRR